MRDFLVYCCTERISDDGGDGHGFRDEYGHEDCCDVFYRGSFDS